MTAGLRNGGYEGAGQQRNVIVVGESRPFKEIEYELCFRVMWLSAIPALFFVHEWENSQKRKHVFLPDAEKARHSRRALSVLS